MAGVRVKPSFQTAANSAAMGGAYRAAYLAQGGTESGPFSQVGHLTPDT